MHSAMTQVCSLFLLILLSFYSYLTISETTNYPKTPKTYIISIQNDLKPPKINNIKEWYNSILGNNNTSNTIHNFLHVYSNAFHGFSVRLTPDQIISLKSRPEVTAIYADEILDLHTTRTPNFLGLNSYHNPTGVLKDSNVGSDVVIGVLDTGIWPKSQSFSDDGLDPVPTHFKGECAGGKDFPATFCNKKIIGVRYFSDGIKSVDDSTVSGDGEFDSALDRNGHGTHTSSTMAGRTRSHASFFEYARGEATGIAPRARLSIYKVCWNRGCATSDVLAGFDKAVADGVDIISISLGGPSRRYSSDPVAIVTFAAVEKGVFVSTSAGNSGPYRGGVSNSAPWVTTVGASTIDRSFPAVVNLDIGKTFTGTSLYTGTPLPKQAMYPLVHLNSTWTMAHCLPGSFDEKIVKGKIVVCLPGMTTEVDKGNIVHKAGGVGVVITSDPDDALITHPFLYPGLTIPFDASTKIMSYISKQQTNATLIFQGTEIGHKPAPVVTKFSSRGPGSQSFYVLKPDVIAPGLDILAAWPNFIPPSRLADDPRRTEFNFLSGTSMSCPHVSGVAALLKGSHPDWTPAMIRSAIMTTAYKGYRDAKPLSEQQYENNTSPWDIGAGHVDPERANDPGLVYDLGKDDYVQFLCSSNYSESEVKTIVKGTMSCKNVTSKPWDLNYPAIVVKSGNESIATRTLTNVDTIVSNYMVKVIQPKGVNVTVEPMELKFETKGTRQSFNVTIMPLKNEASLEHEKVGLITWTDGKHNVTIPLILYEEKSYN